MAFYTLSTTSGTDIYSISNKFILIVGLSALHGLQASGCLRQQVRLPPGTICLCGQAGNAAVEYWSEFPTSQTTMALSLAIKRPTGGVNPIEKMVSGPSE